MSIARTGASTGAPSAVVLQVIWVNTWHVNGLVLINCAPMRRWQKVRSVHVGWLGRWIQLFLLICRGVLFVWVIAKGASESA